MKHTEEQPDEMTSERLELADANTALDNIEGALHVACAALKHIRLSPEDKARNSAAVAAFADALTQNELPPLKNKRVGKSALRSWLQEIAASSSGVLEPLRPQKARRA